MELVSRAIEFAVCAHDGMRRKKGNQPYVLHPMEAAAIVGYMTDDQEVIAAAALHDVVEDAGVTLDRIGELFGERVRQLVESETENKREELPPAETWQIRKEESLEFLKSTDDIGIKMLYIGDKLANMRAIHREWLEKGDAMWERFNRKDPSSQAWYYRTIAQLTSELSSHTAWQEYSRLVETVFKER